MSLLEIAPPHSIEAEQGVLGGLMLDNSTWDLVADQLTDKDFFRHDHRLLFQSIANLAQNDTPFDVVTVAEQVHELDEIGGLAYLGELAKNTPSVANIKAYAKIVRERAHLRRLIQLGYECSRTASEPGAKSLEVQEAIEQQLFALAQDRQREAFVDLNQCLVGVIDEIDRHFNSGSATTG
ncbi:DnaB-like helicase N-terminal domain-containing protein, partial [Devosia sp.]|uniref:DnaB-like helicase N-terminal domain-containing protein n=1 Tax=Devosia sp. TaxID=1871048 RepID=UPI002FCBD324